MGFLPNALRFCCRGVRRSRAAPKQNLLARLRRANAPVSSKRGLGSGHRNLIGRTRRGLPASVVLGLRSPSATQLDQLSPVDSSSRGCGAGPCRGRVEPAGRA